MDLTTQKAETMAVLRNIAAKGPLPERANVDFQFLPQAESADWQALSEEAHGLGHKVRWYQKDVSRPYIEITVTDCPLIFASIWTHEEKLTILAISHGFLPDGWGFFVSPE